MQTPEKVHVLQTDTCYAPFYTQLFWLTGLKKTIRAQSTYKDIMMHSLHHIQTHTRTCTFSHTHTHTRLVPPVEREDARNKDQKDCAFWFADRNQNAPSFFWAKNKNYGWHLPFPQKELNRPNFYSDILQTNADDPSRTAICQLPAWFCCCSFTDRTGYRRRSAWDLEHQGVIIHLMVFHR